MEGRKLLLVTPCDESDMPTGRTLVAADSTGAGPGERVFFVQGREASLAFLPDRVPADAAVVGIVDTLRRSREPAL